MDVGDGYYGVATGACILISLVAHLLSVVLLTSGFFAGLCLRRALAIAALLVLAADHLFIAWVSFQESFDIWREIFLGIDRAGKLVWGWNIVFAVQSSYVILFSALMLLHQAGTDKPATSEATTDSL